jgi:hypothetical protein
LFLFNIPFGGIESQRRPGGQTADHDSHHDIGGVMEPAVYGASASVVLSARW